MCIFWSEKFPQLFPGTIAEEDDDRNLDADYVNVDLDDGDNRDAHLDQVRYLPPEYPLVGKVTMNF